jgi:hypothetical protein
MSKTKRRNQVFTLKISAEFSMSATAIQHSFAPGRDLIDLVITRCD